MRLAHQSEMEIVMLRKKAGGSRLNVDEHARKIVVTLLHDNVGDTYSAVYKELYKDQQGIKRRQILDLDLRLSAADVEAAAALELKWDHLHLWFELPLSQKFSVK